MKASRRCRSIPVTRRENLFRQPPVKNSQGRKGGEMKQKPKPDEVSFLRHKVQSINNELLELNVLLHSELEDVDVLCLSEHWLREEYIKLISIDKFKLASNFSRSESGNGGSCIFLTPKAN